MTTSTNGTSDAVAAAIACCSDTRCPENKGIRSCWPTRSADPRGRVLYSG